MLQGSHNSKVVGKNTQRIIGWAIVPLLLLLLPLIATMITDEVQWDVADFAFAGFLLAAAGIIYALLTSTRNTTFFRSICGLAILLAVFLIWIEFAVGIFD
jgi:hypothetical protein